MRLLRVWGVSRSSSAEERAKRRRGLTSGTQPCSSSVRSSCRFLLRIVGSWMCCCLLCCLRHERRQGRETRRRRSRTFRQSDLACFFQHTHFLSPSPSSAASSSRCSSSSSSSCRRQSLCLTSCCWYSSHRCYSLCWSASSSTAVSCHWLCFTCSSSSSGAVA